ncbi:hypothetical protein Tco_0323470, partial [Tanacetum coccineum]
ELGRHMTAFKTRVRKDTDKVYTRWRQRLDYPERLGGNRLMPVILPAERLCHCALPILGQISKIRELHAADHRRQAMIFRDAEGRP